MNKLSQFHDKKTKKLVDKEVKQRSSSQETSRVGDDLLLQSVKNRYRPKKVTLTLKINKPKSKQSKRTTPGEVIGKGEASPHYAQVEGSRWNKVLTLQNKVKAKRLQRATSKLTKR